MPRRLLAVNVVLAGVSLLCVVLIVKELIGSRPAPSRSRAPAATPVAPPPAAESPRLPAEAYSAIAPRSPFSPPRPGHSRRHRAPSGRRRSCRPGSPCRRRRCSSQRRACQRQFLSAGPRRVSGAVFLPFRSSRRSHSSRPRRTSVKRLVATLTLLALASGCTATRPKTPASSTEPPLAAPTPPPPTPQPLPPLPPASVGPRALTPVQPAIEPPPAPPIPLPPTAPPVPPTQRGRFVVLNFDNADVETVIQAASEIIGFNYVLSPDVRGKVTVQTSGRIAQEEVFGVLLAILEVHGFTAVKAGELYKNVRLHGARGAPLPTVGGPVPDPNRTTDEIITQIVPIKYSAVADLSALLRPLISTRGTLIAHRETNVLIITDTASNVTRLLDIIRLVDVQVAQEELQIIPVTYADSAELATILTQLFASGRIRSTAPGTPP